MRARIIGLGLIGGSIGIALRRAGWRVSYDDPRVRLDAAVAAGAADDADPSPADIAILATPVDAAVTLLPAIRGVTTSVCSVMHPLRAVAGRSDFVAGHPMAGSAQRGLQAASGDLFRGKRWFIDADNEIVDQIIAICGAERDKVDAAQHDAAVALTSHLPQVLSTALAAYLSERDVAEFAGPGLATFLRLAHSDAAVWKPIIDANHANIEPHVEALARIIAQVLKGDEEAFRRAQEFMAGMDSPRTTT